MAPTRLIALPARWVVCVQGQSWEGAVVKGWLLSWMRLHVTLLISKPWNHGVFRSRMHFKVLKGKAQCICQLIKENWLIFEIFLYNSVEILYCGRVRNEPPYVS